MFVYVHVVFPTDLGSVAKRLGVVASQLYAAVKNIGTDELVAHWKPYLSWTHNAEVEYISQTLITSD